MEVSTGLRSDDWLTSGVCGEVRLEIPDILQGSVHQILAGSAYAIAAYLWVTLAFAVA